ncbi:receptor tyrosine-protein kinase erbB-3b [Trichomycterus rosablanca]|uniref:receptor tyrosine-protein kinase erbB-3b n=1 Tax=Trichomycterus rosablanca TaxID=2290929 RepID=UPI002F352067
MRLQVLAVLLLHLQAAAAQTQEVCLGTKNGLSFTDSPAQHYANLKERFNGCEIIMGNLEITQMERDFDFSFLRSVREVTGYVLIATNQFSRLPLEQLRVIRGSTLYEKEWALSVFLNHEDENGLVDLGLTHLTEILQGGVQIVNNIYLSYAPWINWHDIVGDSNATIQISDNGKKVSCNPDCKGYCWGPNKTQCQILTKTVCAPQCHGRCFGPSPQHCCNTECAGGCTGPKETDCFACRHVNHSGACVPHCPQPLIYNKQTFQLEPNPNAMYQYGSVCVHKCPTHFLVDGSACVSSCPPDKMEVERNGMKQCEPCNGLCPKVCEGTDPSKSNRQTVDSSNIDSFINCTKIQGSLHFLVMGIHGDAFLGIPRLDSEKLKVFSAVREITGILNIQSWPSDLKNLSIFSNLTTIRGRSLHQPFSLLVMKVDSLTSLGLRSLQEINDGSVYISNNTNLCYHHTVDWLQIFSGTRAKRRRSFNDIKFNKPQSRCEAEGHVCDPLCSDSGCWGPGPDQCLSCRNHSRHQTCVAQCHIYSGETREFAGPGGECRACHTECLPQDGTETCRGEGADDCVACSNLMDGPHCVSSCPNGVIGEKGQAVYKYPNSKRQCQPCNPSCEMGCTGPHLRHCIDSDGTSDSPHIAGVVSGVLAGLIVCLALVVMALLYRRGLAIRRKRALRRYLENGDNTEPQEPSEKGTKVHARILRPNDLRKGKLLGSGVFGTVHKGFWTPEGDSLKIPVAIKTIQDRSGHHNFTEITDHMLSMGSLDHPYIVRLLGICPGQSLQLVTQLSTHGSLLQHLRQNTHNLDPQRLLNWCVQIAKGMYYLEEHRMVHRNLAARNILLKSDYIVQIADFGVADLLYPDDKKYVYKTPIKWMALESILFRRYTHQSDVWSYGVTVWEMMSYGAEPYAFMHPQDVPSLLEKGERLAQPHICTIDVYMVMVKCWMIDENIRPTFKELANEFTKMARDPPRYLVIKKDQNGNAADEINFREPRLTQAELESEDEEVDDGFNTPPLHISPSRSRLRIGSYRSNTGQSMPVGYLPMTPSAGDDFRQQRSQRRRLGSARTTSESSEGRGTMVDVEIGDITSQDGSLRRGRSRGDSAYRSNCVSVASDPLSPGIEVVEEDSDGYVLPRSANISERDVLLTRSSSRASRASKNGRIHLSPLVLVTDPLQEYELMNKRSSHSPGTATDVSSNVPVLQQSPCTDMSCYSSPSPQEPLQTQNAMQCNGTSEKTEDEGESKNDHSDNIAAQDESQSQQTVGEYEYMDIRTDSALEDAQISSAEVPESSDEPRENVIYQNASELSVVTGNASRLSSKPDEDTTVAVQPEEYEDMNSCGRVSMSGAQMEYQNFPAKGRTVTGDDKHVPNIRAFRGACAGVDEKNSNTSFDNPDYWHSRLFHKPDAVCT